MDEPARAVLAQLPAYQPKYPVKWKEVRVQWDHGCSKMLQDSPISAEQKIQVVMAWLSKSGPAFRDYVLGKLVLGFARPKPIPATDEQKKTRRQKAFVRMAYTDDLPHLRAVNKVVSQRLESMPGDTAGSLALIDSQEERERETPGTMFAEFARNIDHQYQIEDSAAHPHDSVFADAAE